MDGDLRMGLFNNYATRNGWVGLSIFRDFACPKTRGMSCTS